MKSKNLKYIEAYIYAKTLNQITLHTSYNNEQSQQKINEARRLSETLLSSCEEKIKEYKLDDISFLMLKKELEKSSTYENTFSINYNKICEMLNNYDNYLQLLKS